MVKNDCCILEKSRWEQIDAFSRVGLESKNSWNRTLKYEIQQKLKQEKFQEVKRNWPMNQSDVFNSFQVRNLTRFKINNYYLTDGKHIRDSFAAHVSGHNNVILFATIASCDSFGCSMSDSLSTPDKILRACTTFRLISRVQCLEEPVKTYNEYIK